MQTGIETPDFLSDAKAARLNEQERLAMVNTIANNPKLATSFRGQAAHERFGLPAVAEAKVADFE